MFKALMVLCKVAMAAPGGKEAAQGSSSSSSSSSSVFNVRKIRSHVERSRAAGSRNGTYDGRSGIAYLVAKLILLYTLAILPRGSSHGNWAAGAVVHG